MKGFHMSFFDSVGGKEPLNSPPAVVPSFFLIARRSASTRAFASESSDLEMVIKRKSFISAERTNESAHSNGKRGS